MPKYTHDLSLIVTIESEHPLIEDVLRLEPEKVRGQIRIAAQSAHQDFRNLGHVYSSRIDNPELGWHDARGFREVSSQINQ